ncbi:MAG: MATE family efflux transporter [Sandaracinus sp.]|nr:MATE family efflux transporter [Sandaracinus sp.]
MSTLADRGRRLLAEGKLAGAVPLFGAPMALGMALYTAFNFVDLWMIGQLGDASAALAALGVCDNVAAVAPIVAHGLSTGAVTLLSFALGRDDAASLRRIAWSSLGLVGVLGLVFGLVGLGGSEWIVRDLMRAKGAAAEEAVPYLQIQLGGSLAIFLLLQVTAILRALGSSVTAAVLLVSGNLLNLALNAVAIYGPGPSPELFAWGAPIAEALGVPRLGVQGAAWATLVARTLPALIGLALVAARCGAPTRDAWVGFRDEVRRIVRLGWPASAQFVLRALGVLALLALVNARWTSESDQHVLTAFGIVLRLESMVLFVGMGWGAAASSFVGVALGRSDVARAKRAAGVATAWGFASAALLAWLYVCFAADVVQIFDASPEVVAVGVEHAHALGWSYAALGAGVVLSQVLAGAGATFQSLLLDVVVLVLAIPAAYLAVLAFDAERVGLWHVLAAGNVAGLVLFGVWTWRGRFFRVPDEASR